jgi:hypothetical protein
MSEKNPKFDSRHTNSNNPNNDAFWQALGYPKRPKNWKELSRSMDLSTSSKSRNKKRFYEEYGYPDDHLAMNKDDY